jgi:sulfate adenylyltransferase/3'-phosphoadenosine 5'-phosphosulfate synthase
LARELRLRNRHATVLDGDEVRGHLSSGLGYSRADRETNVRRVGFVAKLLAEAGACAITATISPYRAMREEQRRSIKNFFEVHCRCDLEVLAARDPKGLYRKAMTGQLKNFTGLDDPYEPPLDPEVELDTGVETEEVSLARILGGLYRYGYLLAHESEPIDDAAKSQSKQRIVSGMRELDAESARAR